MTAPAEALAQRLAERVIDLVVQAIDINALLQLVDLNALLARVDVNAPLDQVDLNALLRQVDLNAVLDQIDINAVLDRVDVNDVVGRIDMERLVEETDLGAIIARSTGGVATEALDSARSGAVGLDQRVDRWVTRLLRRKDPGTVGAAGAAERGGSAASVRTHPGRWVSAQGRDAGSVSRLAAYLIDLIVSSALFELALTAISFVSQIIAGRGISWHRGNIFVIIIYVIWQFVYFGAQWAGRGKTLGMTLLGVHVVRADGARLEPWRGWVRSLTFPLGFLTLGLGFLGILVQRRHRALYDLIAGTVVVYAWDARAARLRFLARQAEPIADAGHGPGTAKPAAATADRPVQAARPAP